MLSRFLSLRTLNLNRSWVSSSRLFLSTTPEADSAQQGAVDDAQNAMIDTIYDRCVSSQRYKFFAKQADIQGYPDAGVMFDALARSETELASGLLECYHGRTQSDFMTRDESPVGSTPNNIAAALRASEEQLEDIKDRVQKCEADNDAQLIYCMKQIQECLEGHVVKLNEMHNAMNEEEADDLEE